MEVDHFEAMDSLSSEAHMRAESLEKQIKQSVEAQNAAIKVLNSINEKISKEPGVPAGDKAGMLKMLTEMSMTLSDLQQGVGFVRGELAQVFEMVDSRSSEIISEVQVRHTSHFSL